MDPLDQLLNRTARREIAGPDLFPGEGEAAAREILAGRKEPTAPGKGASLSPLFYPLPRRADRPRLLTGELPQTRLLAANHRELEILRLLALYLGEEPAVRDMVEQTLRRLDRACFGHGCMMGECVGCKIAALRLLSALPGRESWCEELLDLLSKAWRGSDAPPRNLPPFYLLLALGGLGHSPTARRMACDHGDWIRSSLRRTSPGGSSPLAYYTPIRRRVLEQSLLLLPEHWDIRLPV